MKLSQRTKDLLYFLIFASALMLIFPDSRAEVRPVVNLASKHFGAGEYNERNLGLGVEYSQAGALYATAGAYHNSEWNVSVYAGVGHEGFPLGTRHLKLGIEAGLVTGYSKAPVLPVVSPVLRIADHIKLLYIPKYGTSPHVLGLQVTF